MKTKYVSKNTAKFVRSGYNRKVIKAELLWGDRIKIDENVLNADGYIKCKARGNSGFIEPNSYGDESLLEVYVIDVGQGDGMLIKCPDPNKSKLGRHIMIDGGYLREKQPTFKNAADFVDWKFSKEYGADKIELDDMIISHCDADHYGGLWDLISTSPEAKDDLDTDEVKVKNFYHAGISWVRKKPKDRSLGIEQGGKLKTIFTDKQSFVNALDKNKYPQLQGEWGSFIEELIDSDAAENINILGYDSTIGGDQYMPNYAPNESDVHIKVLGPIQDKNNNDDIELFDLGSHSKNTNGNSIVLSLKYKQFKLLLTGDLNKPSQDLLSQYHDKKEFASDVAKACHHGSEKVSYKFLEHVNAAATIISSGDNESHAHPTPNLMAMAAITGFKTTYGDSLKTPLIYATEIARSMRIGTPLSANINHPKDNNIANNLVINNLSEIWVNYKRTNAGDLKAAKKLRTLDRLTVVDGIIYGLVNVRTDGNKILIAVLSEKGHKWDYKTFNSRFEEIA
ncbi:ComEC/Rec2 family competence protein [Aureibaculum conchae]|uniref:ComEC/Rec2 family competence protein n=1 Tax=Aureibaculum sp. 2308TA14-22 TaxID=3108392 RepID=UPI00339B3F90